jgi:alcohol dehydrogenase
MADFIFRISPQVSIGQDALLRLPLVVGAMADRVVLVVDPLLYEYGVPDRVRALLEERGVQVIVFDEINAHASSRDADAAIAIARGARAPAIVAVGGLKAAWIGKAVASIAGGPGSLDDALDGTPPSYPPLAFVQVPTSMRDPLLLTDAYSLADGRDRTVKYVQAQPGVSRAVLVDPKLSSTLSAKQSASATIGALMSAIEGYVSTKSNFMSDVALERAIAFLSQALDQLMARPDDPTVHALAWQGSFLASIALATSSPGLGTAISLAINGRYPVPKSALAAVLLPYMMEGAARSRLEKIAALAPLMGEDVSSLDTERAAVRSIESIRTRLGMLKIPSRLKDFDLQLDQLVEMASVARSLDMVNYTPRMMSVDDVFDIIKMAY